MATWFLGIAISVIAILVIAGVAIEQWIWLIVLQQDMPITRIAMS